MTEALSTRILAHYLGGEDALSPVARADDAQSAAGGRRLLAVRLEDAPRCVAVRVSCISFLMRRGEVE